MATKTAKFSANTTWQKIVDGPRTVSLNPVTGFSEIFIGASLPNANEANTFLVKPVAGENYLTLTLDSSTDLFIRSTHTANAVVSWIEEDTSGSGGDVSDPTVVTGTEEVFYVTLTLDTNAYAAGDVLVVPQAIPNVFTASGGKRVLHSVVFRDEDDQCQPFDIILLDATANLGTINSTVSVSDADARKIVGIVKIEAIDYYDLVNSRIAIKPNVGLVLEAASGSTSLYIGAISRGTGTYTASGVRVKLGFI